MKKIHIKKMMVLIAVITLITMSGCAQQEEHGLSAKDPVEITIWNYYNGAQAIAFEDVVAEFNNSVGMEKGIIVNAESKSGIAELSEAVFDSANKKPGADEMPNIFQSYLDTAIELDQLSVLADLNQYMSEEEKATYMDAYVEEGYFGKEGEWKLFPIAKSTEILALNKTDWDKFKYATGVSERDLATWEGLNEVAAKYYEYSDGKSFFGRDAFANYLLVGSKQLGKEIFVVEDGTATLQFDQEIMRKLWDNFYVPYVKGYYKQVGRYRTDDIKIGQIIAFIGSTSGTMYFPEEVTIENEEPYPIEQLILPLPNFAGCEPYAVQQGASMAVSKSTPNKEYASVIFLKWFTETKRNLQFAFESGYLPVKKEANELDTLEELMDTTEIASVDKGINTFLVGVQQAKESHLFTSKGFTGGAQARTILENSMKELAILNRGKVEEAVAQGTSEEEALSEYLQDKYFEEWYLQTKTQLEELCQ